MLHAHWLRTARVVGNSGETNSNSTFVFLYQSLQILKLTITQVSISLRIRSQLHLLVWMINQLECNLVLLTIRCKAATVVNVQNVAGSCIKEVVRAYNKVLYVLFVIRSIITSYQCIRQSSKEN